MIRTVLIFTFLAYWPSATMAQNASSSSCDVPIVVADIYNRPVRELTPADFSVRVAGVPTPVSKVSVDSGPKRIAIIVDASSNVPAEEWKLETEMAGELVSHARPGDQFALLVTGDERSSATFSSSAEMSARIRELASSFRNVIASERLYDPLVGAALLFDPPQFGDTVFLFGHYKDSGSTASLDKLRRLILEKRLRFFGMSFQNRFADVPEKVHPNKPLPKSFHLGALEILSRDTGYDFSYHDVRGLAYPGQIPLLKNFLGDLYTWITEPYRVQINTPPVKGGSGLEISIAEMEARKVNQRGLHFPDSLYGCGATTNPTNLGKTASGP